MARTETVTVAFTDRHRPLEAEQLGMARVELVRFERLTERL